MSEVRSVTLLSLFRYQEEKRDRRGKRRNKHKKADSGSGGYIEQLKRRVDRLEERKLVIENELSKRGEKL